jgi:hypothetical protein
MKDALLKQLDKINARIAWMQDAAENGPENLYCDGERSHAEVEAEFRSLFREQNRLEAALKKV